MSNILLETFIKPIGEYRDMNLIKKLKKWFETEESGQYSTINWNKVYMDSR